MNFKAAVICSTAIHAGFLGLRPPAGLVPPRQTLYPLEVSYVILQGERPTPKVAPRPKEPQASRAADPAKPARPEPLPPKPEEPRKSEERPRPAEPPARPPGAKPSPAVTPGGRSSPVADLPSSGPRAAAMPEGEFAAIRHKELVREHLRRELRYPETALQGMVRLKVTVLPDGSLKDAVVSDASDPRLAAIALRDARSAGPYPRFPKETSSSEAEYEFLVQYRPDGISS